MCNQVQWLLQRSYFTRTQKTLFIIAALMVLLLLLPGHAYSEEVFLSWDPNQESDLSGYRIFYGTTSGSHSVKIEVGNTSTYMLTNLESGKTYCFSATAFDTSGNESEFSEEIS
jgi:hypothetical protein